MRGRIKAKSSIGVSCVAADETAHRTVLGYFTLAMASAAREAFPKKYVRGLPPYDLPLTFTWRCLPIPRRALRRYRRGLSVAGKTNCCPDTAVVKTSG